MVHQESKQGARSEAETERVVEQARAIAALTLALDGFDLERLGDLYQSASALICDAEGRQHLKEVKETIFSVIEDYLENQNQALSRIAEEGKFSVEIARDVALKLTDLFEQYSRIVRWPEIFAPLVIKYATVAAEVTAHFDPIIADHSSQLREKFGEAARDLQGAFEALPTKRDRSNSIASAREIAARLREAFDASVDIENAFAWRLGKAVRTIYRKILRSIDEEFGVNTTLPEVPMDPSATIVPRKIPRNW